MNVLKVFFDDYGNRATIDRSQRPTYRGGRTVANYDRGWDIKPDESNKEAMQAYNIILEKYN